MNKIIERFLIFFIGLPLLVCLVLFLPQRHNLALNLVVVLVSALGSVEMAGMLKRKGAPLPPVEAGILGALLPLAMTAVVCFGVDPLFVPGVVMLAVSWLLVSRTLGGAEKLEGLLPLVAAGFSVLIYPGFFLVWIIRLVRYPRGHLIVLIFLLMVFAFDSAAWAAGMLFGKGNRNIIPASPNKSVAGFVGGLAASTLLGLGVVSLLPEPFTPRYIPGVLSGLILGCLSGFAAAFGDLAESALKRSCGIKDSGALIPGRGGVLDSVDSVAMAAPVYYVLYRFLF
ncbi:MAG: phosphatidate cytidylyltransferase [Spirochaetaceae bacterium]|jgi:phosphatidate cytidylyltransferase|nr:phosphatidate cytidylyltransferase [Spirochaetaceae bacterium]